MTHGRSIVGALGVAWIVLVGALVVRLCRRSLPSQPRGLSWDQVAAPAALISVPAALFYLVGHFNSAGYAMTYAGLGVALAAAGLQQLLERLRTPGSVVTLLILCTGLLNGATFIAGDQGTTEGQSAFSAVELRSHDEYYRELGPFLRSRWPAGRPLVLGSSTSSDGLRLVQHLLPDFRDAVVQAVDSHVELPASIRRLGWLRLLTPPEIDRMNRPVAAVARTRADRRHQETLFPGRWRTEYLPGGQMVFLLHRGREAVALEKLPGGVAQPGAPPDHRQGTTGSRLP